MPFTWLPSTTICGNCMESEPTVLNTSWSLFMTGIKASIINKCEKCETRTTTTRGVSRNKNDSSPLDEHNLK